MDATFESYVRSELAKYDARIEELENTIEQKDERIAELETTVEQLDARTDMLRLVENSDEMDGEQRSTALLQHLRKQALKTIGDDRAAISRDRAEQILHYPDIHRTTLITDMQRCVRLVDDETVCWYEGRDDGPEREARLILDLERGEVPATLSTDLEGGE